MSILDDAIREHLELKRAHGADDDELKRLEDEAFGPPQRPDEIDPFAEAPTEFLSAPTETAADLPALGDEAERSDRRPNITDLQEEPPPEAPAPGEAPEVAPPAEPAGPEDVLFPPEDAAASPEDTLSPAPDAPPPSPRNAVADAPPPPPGEARTDLAPPTEPPAEEEHPAAEHEIVPEHGPDTEERHAIADQPTQMFDVQAQMDAEAAAALPAEQVSPSDEELVDAAQEEPQAAPPAPEGSAAPLAPPTDEPGQPPLESRGPDAEVAGHPPAEAEPEEESAEFDFLNEQRLADELDQALEAPVPAEEKLPQYEDASAEGGAGIFDFESQGAYEEDPSEEVLRRADEREAESEEVPRGFAEPPSEEALGPFAEPPSKEAPFDATVEQPRPTPEPPSEESPRDLAEPPSEESRRDLAEPPSEETRRSAEEAEGAEEPAEDDDDYDFDPETGHEDVLEDTPRFLEDEDDDDLWFEQRPPKDFDLD